MLPESATADPTTATPVDALARVQKLEDDHLMRTYGRIPLLLERGKGPYVFDHTGRKYLDFITGIGVNALGYAHPRLLKVIKEQSAKLIHASNLYYNPYQGELAERLTRLAGMDRAFFSNSGTEAIEGALKLARRYGTARSAEKFEVVTLDNSFHGRTYGAMSLTGQPKYRESFQPLVPGIRFVEAGNIAALEAAVGPQTCAILLEPIQGEGGIFEMDVAFMQAAADLARRHDALLLFDEVQCGLARSGRPFAFQWTEIVPDVVITAKPIANGLPLGCLMARGAAADIFTPGLHGSTFGGGPLTCRVALEVLDIIEQDHLMEHIQAMGALLKTGLQELAAKFKCVKEVRGRGLMLGLDLKVPAKPVVDAARAEGLLVNATHETVVRMLPPFIVEEKHIQWALRRLRRALKKAGGSVERQA